MNSATMTGSGRAQRDKAFLDRHRKLADPADKVVGYESGEQVDIAGTMVLGSMKDLSFRLFDGIRTEVVPRSQVKDNGDGTFNMPMWLAKKKGFV